MIYYRIPNWADYQQYKDRDPSWIKLHKRILNNRAYMELPLEAKGLLPMMWILASESSQPREGIIEIDDDDIAFRLRVKKDVLLKNIAILVSACFITDVRSRTELYTEKRREETETYRKETEDNMSDFEELWKMYPRRDGSKKRAKELYKKALKEGATHGQITDGIRRYEEKLRAEGTEQRFIAHCTTWLNEKRWESDYSIAKPKGNEWANAAEEYIATLGTGQGRIG